MEDYPLRRLKVSTRYDKAKETRINVGRKGNNNDIHQDAPTSARAVIRGGAKVVATPTTVPGRVVIVVGSMDLEAKANHVNIWEMIGDPIIVHTGQTRFSDLRISPRYGTGFRLPQWCHRARHHRHHSKIHHSIAAAAAAAA